jgi:hypothetical protein
MAYNPNNPNGRTTASASAPVVLANDVTPPFSIAEATTGGASVFRLVSASGQNITQVKTPAGQAKITGWYIYNSNGSARTLRFFNVAVAPTLLTAPYLTITIPALSAANCPFPAGIDFSNGIYIATTTASDDAAAGGVSAGDLIINIFYK